MAKTPRNIRFDDDLYKEMKAIASYPLTAAYHIQEACREYLKGFGEPVVKVPKKPATVDINAALEDVFEVVWEAYGKKGNKKTSKIKFNRLNKMDRQFLVDSIPAYVLSTPEKKYRKNFETYINQECWNDEVTPNGQNQPGTNAAGYRLSAVDRVRARNEENRANRAASRGDGEHVANTDGHIRVILSEAIRGGDAGSVGITIEGDYTQTNS